MKLKAGLIFILSPIFLTSPTTPTGFHTCSQLPHCLPWRALWKQPVNGNTAGALEVFLVLQDRDPLRHARPQPQEGNLRSICATVLRRRKRCWNLFSSNWVLNPCSVQDPLGLFRYSIQEQHNTELSVLHYSGHYTKHRCTVTPHPVYFKEEIKKKKKTAYTHGQRMMITSSSFFMVCVL